MPKDVEPINFHFYSSLRISVRDRFRSAAARSALYHVETYVNGLVVQWNRMAEDVALSSRIMETENLMENVEAAKVDSQLGDRFQLDIHFYLICWDKIQKHLALFDRSQGDSVISAIRARIRTMLAHAVRARNFLEHLDKQITETMFGMRSTSISSDGQFTFRYEDMSKRGAKHERVVTLGRTEVLQVLLAYIDLLERLGVNPQSLRPRPA
jgi:hypothetical protein